MGTCKNQREEILAYIDEHGSITSLEAMQNLGIIRLASRISELKKAGVNIVAEYETSKNRYGESTHYCRYSVKE